jgi:uncharacterized alpha-E superfamily protein
MLSRTADSIYWMSRYMERAENVARFIAVNLQALLDLPMGFREQWEPLVTTSGDSELFTKLYGDPSQVATKQNVIRFLTFDSKNPNSIVSCVSWARENARQVRQIVSVEMWEALNTFYLRLHEPSAPIRAEMDPDDFFREIRQGVQLFSGIADVSLARDEAWQFFQLGRWLERADKTSRILDVKYFILLPNSSDVNSVVDDLLWGVLLHSVSGYEVFRRAYGRISPEKVVEFLLVSREFPRSVLFCLQRAEKALLAISGTPEGSYRLEPEKLLSRLRSELAYASVREVLGQGLHEFLDTLQTHLNGLSAALDRTFFVLPTMEDEGLAKQQ